MTETTRSRFTRLRSADDDLFDAGFTRARGAGGYRRGRLSLTREGPWHALRAKARGRDHAGRSLGQPGLWKVVHCAGGRRERVFDVPELTNLPGDADRIGDAGGDHQPESPLRMMLEWAAATADGRAPADWRPPPVETVRQWTSPAALTVRSGGIVRQVEIVSDPESLALRCRVVGVPAELSAERRAWLDRLATDTNDRWRLVRLGWEGVDGSAAAGPVAADLVAEVDLTGCPAGVLEAVFRAALAALRWVVGWVVRSADFLADPACGSVLLEAAPSPGSSAALVPA